MHVRKDFELRLPSRTLQLGRRTLVMGVLNVTPDSFFDGGRYFTVQQAIDQGLRLEDDGADILDVGGESTRPSRNGALSADEERCRVLPIIEKVMNRLSIPLSIDTYKHEVARAALAAGAELVNDISGLRFDPQMPGIVAERQAAIVLMHSRGRLDTLHTLPPVKNILRSVRGGLRRATKKALAAGLQKECIILDPGLGFGKTAENNLHLLKRLRQFGALNYPVLIGASRKSFIGSVLNLPASQRLNGSLASIAIAILNGAHIVRVHDVRESKEVARVCDAIVNA